MFPAGLTNANILRKKKKSIGRKKWLALALIQLVIVMCEDGLRKKKTAYKKRKKEGTCKDKQEQCNAANQGESKTIRGRRRQKTVTWWL